MVLNQVKGNSVSSTILPFLVDWSVTGGTDFVIHLKNKESHTDSITKEKLNLVIILLATVCLSKQVVFQGCRALPFHMCFILQMVCAMLRVGQLIHFFMILPLWWWEGTK